MSLSLTAMIGALVALLPPALLQRQDKDSPAVKLARSNARLIDHIQSLERELLTERHLTQTRIEEIENLNRDLVIQRHLVAHWREEAMRIAREVAQVRRLASDWQMRAQPQDGRHALQHGQQNALSQQAQAQAQLAQYAQAMQTQAGAYPDFCNCVPSRAQVWSALADHSLVDRLNRGEK